jgi:dTDP-4-dehydrorhamnose 3,5-epimerase
MNIETKDLDVHLDDRGYIAELLREDDDIVSETFAQITLSEIYPDSIKAWHRHQRQTDFIACVNGNLRVGFAAEGNNGVDVETVCIGEDNQELVKIPAGIWHGITPIGGESATVIYIHDQTYNPDDEERRPYDTFGDVWKTNHR